MGSARVRSRLTHPTSGHRPRLALRQLDNFALAFHRIIYRHLDDWVTFLNCQSCRLGLFMRRVGFLGLSIHLESEGSFFRPPALPELFLCRFFRVAPLRYGDL